MACSLVSRSYVEADRPAVLALFDANVPAPFNPEERAGSRTSATAWDQLVGPPVKHPFFEPASTCLVVCGKARRPGSQTHSNSGVSGST